MRVILGLILGMILILPSTGHSLAVSEDQMKECLSKLPKTATTAEKTALKNKCNSEIRSGKNLPKKFELSMPNGKFTLTESQLCEQFPQYCVNGKIMSEKESSTYQKYLGGSNYPNNPKYQPKSEDSIAEYANFVSWLGQQIEPLKSLNEKLLKEIDSNDKYTVNEKASLKKKISDKIITTIQESNAVLNSKNVYHNTLTLKLRFDDLKNDPIIQFKPTPFNGKSIEFNADKQSKKKLLKNELLERMEQQLTKNDTNSRVEIPKKKTSFDSKKSQYSRETNLLLMKGDRAYSAGFKNEAIEIFDEVLKNDEKNSMALFWKGQILSDLGKYDEAISLYNIALKDDPDDINNLWGKALALHNTKKYDEAIVIYDHIIKLTQNDRTNSSGLAKQYKQLAKNDNPLPH